MRRSRWCDYIGIALGLVFVAPPMTMLLDRRTVIELDAANSTVSPHDARTGEVVLITWRAIPHRNCAGVVIPRVIDSSGRIFEYARIPTVYQDLMRPDQRSFTKTVTLPTSMALGPARYEAVIIRWCNVIQQYAWPMIDSPFPIPFNVVP